MAAELLDFVGCTSQYTAITNKLLPKNIGYVHCSHSVHMLWLIYSQFCMHRLNTVLTFCGLVFSCIIIYIYISTKGMGSWYFLTKEYRSVKTSSSSAVVVLSPLQKLSYQFESNLVGSFNSKTFIWSEIFSVFTQGKLWPKVKTVKKRKST